MRRKPKTRKYLPLAEEIRGVGEGRGYPHTTACFKGPSVPTGQIWVVTLISMRHDGWYPVSYLAAKKVAKEYEKIVRYIPSPWKNYWYHHPCKVVLQAGERLELWTYDLMPSNEVTLYYQGIISMKCNPDGQIDIVGPVEDTKDSESLSPCIKWR